MPETRDKNKPEDSQEFDPSTENRENMKKALDEEDRKNYEELQKKNQFDHKTEVNIH